MKKLLRTQTGRFVAGLVALLILVCAAGAAQKLPLKADITPQKLMTMSEKSLDVVKELDEEIDLYYMATESGKELWVDELAQKYAEASGFISYEMIDPSTAHAADIATMAGMALAENSLVVASGRRMYTITPDSLYSTQYNQMYYYYYGELVADAQYFVADSELMNAILYVTRDDLPVVYALTGHGEVTAAGQMLASIQKYNVVVEQMRLDGNAVPDDAAAVLIYGPSGDITKSEADALLDYLKDGGNLILLTDYMMGDLPNLEAVADYYGMKQVEGIILDMTSGYSYSTDYPQYLMPDVSEHEVTSVLFNYNAKPIISYASAMERGEVEREGLEVTTLLTTSDAAYMKNAAVAMSTALEEGDPVGKFAVAMAAEEGGTKFVWFTSASFLDDTDVNVSSGGNLFLLENMLEWMVPLVERETFMGGNLVLEALKVPENIPAAAVYAALFVPAVIMLAVGMLRGRKKKA